MGEILARLVSSVIEGGPYAWHDVDDLYQYIFRAGSMYLVPILVLLALSRASYAALLRRQEFLADRLAFVTMGAPKDFFERFGKDASARTFWQTVSGLFSIFPAATKRREFLESLHRSDYTSLFDYWWLGLFCGFGSAWMGDFRLRDWIPEPVNNGRFTTAGNQGEVLAHFFMSSNTNAFLIVAILIVAAISMLFPFYGFVHFLCRDLLASKVHESSFWKRCALVPLFFILGRIVGELGWIGNLREPNYWSFHGSYSALDAIGLKAGFNGILQNAKLYADLAFSAFTCGFTFWRAIRSRMGRNNKAVMAAALATLYASVNCTDFVITSIAEWSGWEAEIKRSDLDVRITIAGYAITFTILLVCLGLIMVIFRPKTKFVPEWIVLRIQTASDVSQARIPLDVSHIHSKRPRFRGSALITSAYLSLCFLYGLINIEMRESVVILACSRGGNIAPRADDTFNVASLELADALNSEFDSAETVLTKPRIKVVSCSDTGNVKRAWGDSLAIALGKVEWRSYPSRITVDLTPGDRPDIVRVSTRAGVDGDFVRSMTPKSAPSSTQRHPNPAEPIAAGLISKFFPYFVMSRVSQSDPTKAREIGYSIIETRPSWDPMTLYAENLLGKMIDADALQYRRQKDYDRFRSTSKAAADYYNRVLDTDPSMGPAWINLMVNQIERGDIDSSVHSLERAVDFLPGSSELHDYLGVALVIQWRTKNVPGAIPSALAERACEQLAMARHLDSKWNETTSSFMQFFKPEYRFDASRLCTNATL